MEQIKNTKPLGHKAYGSIPHLPGSRLGTGDHHCESGQARIATEKARDKHDVIIIQEKLDGSNCSIVKLNGQILALTRSGYLALTSQYEQHQYFYKWVMKNEERFVSLLKEGERACGEWLLQAHGTKYNLPHEPFVVFDIMAGQTRMPFDSFMDRILFSSFTTPTIISKGEPMPVNEALNYLGERGWHGSTEAVEGLIYRVERKGVVDFLAKFVHHNKQDGKYLPEKNGSNLPIYNNFPYQDRFFDNL